MERYKYVESPENLGVLESVAYSIIRPPKMTYDLEDLGPDVFMNKVGTPIRRIDRQIPHEN